MSKFERIFYVVVILAMFALVILFQLRLRETRSKMTVNAQSQQNQVHQIFSFKGESSEGEKSFVHFTAYSPNYYIFLNTSTDCSHCLSMLQELQDFKPEGNLPENLYIYLIAEELPAPLPPKGSPTRTLKVSFEDLFQFGSVTPSVTAVDGRGNVINQWKGFSREILKQAIQAIREDSNANSRSIQVNDE